MYGYFDVTSYGAVGDGMTDSAPGFNMANTLAVAAGGGYIYVPPGLYLLKSAVLLGSTSPTPQDTPITLAGDGAAVSVLLAYNMPSGTGAIMVANAQWNTTSTSYVQQDIYIEKLGFNCNGVQNNKAQGPIYLKQVLNCGVRDCEIFNSSTAGILIIGRDTPSEWPANDINFHILNNKINLNMDNEGTLGVYPIRVTGASIGLIQGNIIGDLNSGRNTNDAISLPGCSDIACCENYLTACLGGIVASGGTDIVISNNRIIEAQGIGVSTLSSAGLGNNGVSTLAITGNTIVTAGSGGIRVSSPNTSDSSVNVSIDFAVTGNVVSLSAEATQAGINIQASQGCVTANAIDLGGSGQTGINLDPSMTVGSGQHGANNITCCDNMISNGGGTGSGSTGLAFESVSGKSFTDCYVANNNVDTSTIPNPISLPALTSLVNCVIRNNVGINPYVLSPILPPGIPSSPSMPVSNTFPFDMDVYVTGGTYLEILINGQNTSIRDGAFFVEVGGNIEWYGTLGAMPPTSWAWIPR